MNNTWFTVNYAIIVWFIYILKVCMYSIHSQEPQLCYEILLICSYVYVPILPAPLYEVLNTPTPFIAGVHSSLADDTADLVCK